VLTKRIAASGDENGEEGERPEHVHSCVMETGFENRSVLTTNLDDGYMKECIGCRQRYLSFLSFFSGRERPLLAGNDLNDSIAYFPFKVSVVVARPQYRRAVSRFSLQPLKLI